MTGPDDVERAPALRTVELKKVYASLAGPVAAVDGVDLEVGAGEFLAVMGPSGCGKSTLLHLLGGLDRPSGGEVWLGGSRIDTLGESARAVLRRRAVGFVFQTYNLVPSLTVAANVELPGVLAGRPRRQLAARRAELLERLELTGNASRGVAELSGGEAQRVALARALVNDPAVLLADEPTGNLDSRASEDVVALLKEFHAGGQAIVLVTHDPKVASASQRVVSMRDGRLVDEARLDRGSSAGRQEVAGLVQLGSGK
jgi:putative ABC transport system ATP-binding protein